jgi:predicted DNA-binding protein YlxM (UPF0122 family)
LTALGKNGVVVMEEARFQLGPQSVREKRSSRSLASFVIKKESDMNENNHSLERYRLPLPLEPNSPSYLATTLTIALMNGGYKVSRNKTIRLGFSWDQKEDALVFVMDAYEQLELPLRQELDRDKFKLKQFIFNNLRRFDRLIRKDGQKVKQLICETDSTIKVNGSVKFVPRSENFEKLYMAIECLNFESRCLLENYFLKGVTIKMLAVSKKVSPQAIFKKIKVALRDLRQILNASGMSRQTNLSESQIVNSLFEVV